MLDISVDVWDGISEFVKHVKLHADSACQVRLTYNFPDWSFVEKIKKRSSIMEELRIAWRS